MNSKRAVVFLSVLFFGGAASPLALGQTPIPLDQAIKDDKVDAEISGIGGSTGDAILITVRRKVPDMLRLTLTPGTVFTSTSGTVQNMVAASVKGERVGENSYRPATEIVLADNDKHSYVVEAYCLDFHKPNPGSSDSFTIASADERARKILQAGKAKSASIAAIQSALWMQREHLTPAEVKQRFPASDEDIAVAQAIVQSQPTIPQGSPKLPVPAESKPNGRAEADAQLWSWLEQKGRFYDLHERKEVLVGDPLKIPKVIARLEKPLPEKAVADQFGRPTDEQKVSPDSARFFLSTGGRVMPGEKVCRYGNVALLIDAGQVVQAAKFGNDSLAEADRRQTRNQAATRANAAARIIADQKLAKWKSEFESLRKFADAGFPGFIDAADSKPPANTEPGPSIEYIVKAYGPPDRIETRTSQVSGRTRQLYWYGGLAVIASKEDGLIWGFGGKSPKSGPTATPNTRMRKWTDSTGTHTIEAEFVDFKDGKVRLKKKDGSIVSVSREKLSKDDQEYVRSQVTPSNLQNQRKQDGGSETTTVSPPVALPKPPPGGESKGDSVKPRSAVVWAQIVVAFVGEGESKQSAQIADLEAQVFGLPDSGMAGQDIQALWSKRLSIKEIVRRFGEPDKISTHRQAEKQGEKEIQLDCYEYGQVSFGVKKGEDSVSWCYAPRGWWRTGIRAKAEEELKARNDR
jgi:hypothetical protein